MENCGNAGLPMEWYEGMPGRDLVVVPRIVDDACELHMQMHASMFDRDQIVTSAERFGATGLPARQGARPGDRHARVAAGQMLVYSGEKAERHLLFRFNQHVIASIESGTGASH